MRHPEADGCTCRPIGIFLGHGVAVYVSLDGNLGGTKPLQCLDDLRDFLPALTQKHVIRLHVVNAVPSVRQVIGADDEYLRPFVCLRRQTEWQSRNPLGSP